MIGVGLMAGIDEIVFHQLLDWHHFFDRSTPTVGLVSDGLLHTAELLLLVGGFALVFDVCREQSFARREFWAAVLLGLGAFQLFDGVVDHKILRTHQIRYHVELLPYDLMWNAAGVLLLAAGGLLLWRAARIRQRQSG